MRFTLVLTEARIRMGSRGKMLHMCNVLLQILSKVMANHLMDCIGQRLQGWSNKVSSKDGKITLHKTAPQAIPNFRMNLFLIPNETCENIEKQMNGFWWRNSSN
jgi:hypothetical protein